MSKPRRLAVCASYFGLLSCSGGECSLPKEWVLAKSLEPSGALAVHKPVIHAREATPGVWMWRDETGIAPDGEVTLEELLKRLSAAQPLNPQPLFLFSFAKLQDCGQLNTTRTRIAKAIKCSSEEVLCIEGTPDDLE